MNGSIGVGNGVHTVSPKQAKNLVDEVQKSAASCKAKIDQNVNEFFGQLSRVWADKYAVEFAKEVERKISIVVGDLNNKANALMSDIVGLANEYASVGGLGTRIDYTRCSFSVSVNTGAVKEEFADGSSGFIGNNTKVSLGIVGKLETLYKGLAMCGDQLIDAMQRTNAFGNTDVKAMLVVFAKNFKDGMAGEVHGLTSVCQNMISETEKRYQKVSSSYGGSNFSGGRTFSGDNNIPSGGSNIPSGGSNVSSGRPVSSVPAVGDIASAGRVTGEIAGVVASEVTGKVAGEVAKKVINEGLGNTANGLLGAGKVAGVVASQVYKDLEK